MNIMTKEEYLEWLKTRSKNACDWDLETCQKADALIKKEALNTFFEKIDRMDALSDLLKGYLKLMVRLHYGSIETADLLVDLKCYPEWAR